jgi:hypothetical protein|tara:strand:- start:288 stop:500 length:213 start_codon:yes stop_codon:yes gene_type:complete
MIAGDDPKAFRNIWAAMQRNPSGIPASGGGEELEKYEPKLTKNYTKLTPDRQNDDLVRGVCPGDNESRLH